MDNARSALVGGFVLSGLALGVGAVLLFGGTHLLSPTVQAVVYFQGSVAGLDVGAPVTFRGVRVGAVTRVAVKLDMRDLTARIPVYLDLNPTQIAMEDSAGQSSDGLDRLLKAGLRAQLNMQSLITGQLRVDLDLLPGVAAPIVGGDTDRPEIPSVPSKLQTLEDEIAELPLKEMAENARQALVSIQRLSDELAPKAGALADSFAATSEAAHVTLDDIDRLAVAGKHQLAVSGDQLGRVLAASERTAREAETLVGSLKEMTAPESPMRGDLRATLRDLAASAASLRSFSHEVERDPSAILSGRTGH